MKVTVAVDAITPNATGIGRYALELVRRLPDYTAITELGFWRDRGMVEDPSTIPSRPEGWSWRRLRAPKRLRDWYWRRHCRNQIFHSPNYFLPGFVDRGVITVHDLSVFKFPETHPVARVRQFEQQFRHTLSRSAHVITDTRTVRDEFISYFNYPADRVSAIPLGVDSTFSPGALAATQVSLDALGLSAGAYTLCVSTIEPRKRIDRLLRAYRLLPAPLRQAFPLVLVGGSGWNSEREHAAITQAVREGWLRYQGFVDETSLRVLYASARLFVYPSAYEGFGLPVVEAMASGTPVIAANCSCLPEITSGAALLVDPEDIDAFRQHIEYALLDADWRAQAVPAGRRVAQSYSWDTCVGATVNVYGQLATGLDAHLAAL